MVLFEEHDRNRTIHDQSRSFRKQNDKRNKEKNKNFAWAFHSLPADLLKAINATSAVKKIWGELTPIAQNEWICWVTSAKKVETRVKRIERAQDDLKAGKKRPCCWPGCPHRRPNAAKWFNGKTARKV